MEDLISKFETDGRLMVVAGGGATSEGLLVALNQGEIIDVKLTLLVVSVINGMAHYG